jgi:hypothetical protein
VIDQTGAARAPSAARAGSIARSSAKSPTNWAAHTTGPPRRPCFQSRAALATLSRRGPRNAGVYRPLGGLVSGIHRRACHASGLPSNSGRSTTAACQAVVSARSPCSVAQTAICVRDRSRRRPRMCSMCAAAARSVMTRRTAICRLVSPSVISAATYCWRRVSGPAVRRGRGLAAAGVV